MTGRPSAHFQLLLWVWSEDFSIDPVHNEAAQKESGAALRMVEAQHWNHFTLQFLALLPIAKLRFSLRIFQLVGSGYDGTSSVGGCTWLVTSSGSISGAGGCAK
jgi:hypothetical protein